MLFIYADWLLSVQSQTGRSLPTRVVQNGLLTFSKLCDQRTYNLMEHISVIDASCSAGNWPQYFFSPVHLTCIHHIFHITLRMVI